MPATITAKDIHSIASLPMPGSDFETFVIELDVDSDLRLRLQEVLFSKGWIWQSSPGHPLHDLLEGECISLYPRGKTDVGDRHKWLSRLRPTRNDASLWPVIKASKLFNIESWTSIEEKPQTSVDVLKKLTAKAASYEAQYPSSRCWLVNDPTLPGAIGKVFREVEYDYRRGKVKLEPLFGGSPFWVDEDCLGEAAPPPPAPTPPISSDCLIGVDYAKGYAPKAQARLCPREDCSTTLVGERGKETCPSCGYPGLLLVPQAQPVAPFTQWDCRGRARSTPGEDNVKLRRNWAAFVGYGGGLTLKEQAQRTPHWSKLFVKPRFCWRCGSDSGCMCPREDV